MSDFTPGPWEKNGFTVYAINRGGTNRFSIVMSSGWKYGCELKRDDTRTPLYELEANAHLVAAAPDLYEALQEYLDATPFTSEKVEKRAKAKNALAKARGGK